MLKSASDIVVVGFARNGAEVMAKSSKLLPDIVILDVVMPNSNAVNTVRELINLNPRPFIICCSSMTNRETIMSLVNAGINGYLMKSTSGSELKHAIETVMKGKSYFSEEVTSLIIDTIRSDTQKPVDPKEEQLFSEKEMKIIKLICEEKSAKQISEQLNINIRTLESIKIRIMKKMDVKNIASLVYFALKNNYVDIDDLATSI
jgi:DNA-binding NarL/FixJ family response regulator